MKRLNNSGKLYDWRLGNPLIAKTLKERRV